MSIDRLHKNNLVITQELIASLPGVRRESITNAAGKLQKDGLILYARGRITVLDRAKLEERACECYSKGSLNASGCFRNRKSQSVVDESTMYQRMGMRQ